VNYAKSFGKTVEDVANFSGVQIKTGWNQVNGYNGFLNGVKYNWVCIIPNNEFNTLEQDDNHFKFSVKNVFPYLKDNGSLFNVTYDE